VNEQERSDQVVLEHLQLTRTHIAEQTPKFLAQFATFLENTNDPTGLKLSNVRLATQFLKQGFERIDGLLDILEQQREGHTENE